MSASNERQARLAKNEHAFRTVNENIAASADAHGGNRDHPYEFLCECARIDCTDTIRMTLDEYVFIRAKGERFALIAGHEDESIEDVVDRTDRFWIVEKFERGREVAHDLFEQEDQRD